MDKSAGVFVSRPGSMVGAALVRHLVREGYQRVLTVEGGIPRPAVGESDLHPTVLPGERTETPAAVRALFERERPAWAFLYAAESHGIAANRQAPADIMRANLLYELPLIAAAHDCGVRRLMYLASSCCYPRDCPQPMRPEALMTGRLEPTNEAYAVAKLAGLTMCRAYRRQYGDRFMVGIPATVFGPGDDFSVERSHVATALLRRMHEAREAGRHHLDVWGSGAPRRDFIYADDLADACVFAMRHYDGDDPIHLAGGPDCSVRELAEMIREVVGFTGALRFDTSKPDGMLLKVLDTTPLRELGWTPATPLREALALTYRWYLDHARREQAHA